MTSTKLRDNNIRNSYHVHLFKRILYVVLAYTSYQRPQPCKNKKIIIQNHSAKEREGSPASEPTKSDGGKQKKKIQNEEEMTSIAFNIALTLHMALSILTFRKDLPHLSKQEKRHSTSYMSLLKNQRKY
nr:hypothetical protein [Tanacetum cinerariifolium]